MKKAILTTKVGMTQVFSEDGVLTPVTVLQAGPCVVTQVKTVENDGYGAVQVGFGDIREKLVNKPKKGHFAKAVTPAFAKWPFFGHQTKVRPFCKSWRNS